MKKEIREKFLKKRREMGVAELFNLSKDIREHLFSLDAYKKAKTIMVYVSYNKEVDTHEIIKQALSEGKTVCVPVCNTKNCTMTAHKISSFDDLAVGAYGILEPIKANEVLPQEIDLCIIPGAVFGENMHRIGYGKGFYDKFLKFTPAVRVGLAYEFSVVKSVPCENCDEKLDIIMTENRILFLKKG